MINGVSGATPVQTGRINFDITDIAGGVGTIEADLVVRVLNTGINGGDTILTPTGLTVDGHGVTFASSDGLDGYGGSFASLHEEMTFTARVPEITVVKGVRNDTDGDTAFAPSADGDAGDRMRCLLYTSPSPRDQRGSRMPSSA